MLHKVFDYQRRLPSISLWDGEYRSKTNVTIFLEIKSLILKLKKKKIVFNIYTYFPPPPLKSGQYFYVEVLRAEKNYLRAVLRSIPIIINR